MEKGYLVLIAGMMAQTAVCQITIDMADMPQQGDILSYSTTTITAFDTLDTGPNHTWDFGQLIANASDADTAISVNTTPFLYQFYFNNALLYPDHKADLAFRGLEFGAAQFSVSDVFDYFKVDNDGYRNVGFGANINGIPSSVRRIPVDRLYSLPLNYGNTDASFSSFEIQIPTLVYFQEDQWRDNEVDGWGTLTLPSGQYDVLRLKSTIQRNDTIYIDLAGFGFRTQLPATVEYKWLAAGEKQPVLQVTTVGGVPTQVEFKDIPVGIGSSPEKHQQVQLWSVGAELHVLVPPDLSGPVTLEIFDTEGRPVETTRRLGIGLQTVALQALPAAAYVVRATWRGGQQESKILLSR